MVCDRCNMVVQQTVEEFEAQVEEIQLGRILIEINDNFNQKKFKEKLNANGVPKSSNSLFGKVHRSF